MPDPDVRRESWRQIESHLGAVFMAATSPYAVFDRNLRYVAANPAYETVFGRPADELIGALVFDVFPESPDSAVDPESADSLQRSLNAVLSTGTTDAMSLIRYDIEVDGRYEERFWNVTNSPILDADGSVVLILNHPVDVTMFITERLRLQAGGTSEIEPTSRTRAVEEVFVAELSRLESLNELALAMVAASNREEVGRAFVRDGVALVGAAAGSLVMYDSERFEMFAQSGLNDDSSARWSAFTLEAGHEPFSDVILGGESLFFSDRQSLVASYPHLVGDLESYPTHRSWATLPLQVADRVVGAIGLIFDKPQAFNVPIRLVLYTLANLTAQAASRAQLLEEQRTALASVEEALQPRVDPIPDVVVSHIYRAATVGSEAGGDWYDIVHLDDTTTLIAIGDVANHGAVAVGEMSRVRATVHAHAFAGHPPRDIAQLSDRVLSQMASTHTTAIIATLDRPTMSLDWTTAGHPYPVVIAASGEARLLDETHGAPLAVGLTNDYGQQHYQLQVGDTIVLYTDGLIERQDEELDVSMERLRKTAGALAPACGEDLASELFRELRPTGHHTDDIAIVTLSYRPPWS